jgi:ribosome biogenesis GTPase / thiamine phosphate phosphatase
VEALSGETMNDITPIISLRDLGWSPFFQAQLDIDEIGALAPHRVAAVHRNGVELLGAHGTSRATTGPEVEPLAIGDWVLLDGESRLARALERNTELRRRAAGTGRAVQLIAANVDTLFVTSSCNADFNLARLERYLALAAQAGVTPVLVLTKADASPDPDGYVARAGQVAPALVVEALDARDPEAVRRLAPWCGPGQTIAILGSSGVGKSTLVNTLTGAVQATQGIREDDAKGRHTTTARSLHRLAAGGWLIDTPGMRELRLHDAADGVAAVFEDITGLARSCRFTDCSHEDEPGCAVQAAIAAGDVAPERLRRWRKLAREEAHSTASVAEQRRASRAFGRMARAGKAEARRKRGE